MSKEFTKEGLRETLKELDKDLTRSDLVQDNKLNFVLDGKLYRVRMPNQREITLAEERKNTAYIQLIQKDDTLTKKKIKEILKEKKNIDLDVLQDEARRLERKFLDLYISLAQCKSSAKKTIAKLKIQIAEIKEKRQTLVLEMAEYMAPSIESQAEDTYMKYLTSICTEQYIEENKSGRWESVWNTYEEFEKDSTKVTINALAYLTHLLIHVRS